MRNLLFHSAIWYAVCIIFLFCLGSGEEGAEPSAGKENSLTPSNGVSPSVTPEGALWIA